MSTPHPRTIESLFSIASTPLRDVPPLSQSLTPNFSEIRKVYMTFFAPGLDILLETGPTHWFANKGFPLLSDDRTLLAQFMLYLTLVSTSPEISGSGGGYAGVTNPAQAELASQEARVCWLVMNLCVRQAQEGDDEDADRFARRVRALEALLTCEPSVRTGGFRDWVVYGPELPPDQRPSGSVDESGNGNGDGDMEMGGMEGVPTVANNPLLEKPFMKQLSGRSEQFWDVIEEAARDPRDIQAGVVERARGLLDGMEGRDIVYSILLLCRPQNTGSGGGGDVGGARPGTAASERSGLSIGMGQGMNGALKKAERMQATRLLETEWAGSATNIVLQNLAGMGLRAFV